MENFIVLLSVYNMYVMLCVYIQYHEDYSKECYVFILNIMALKFLYVKISILYVDLFLYRRYTAIIT